LCLDGKYLLNKVLLTKPSRTTASPRTK